MSKTVRTKAEPKPLSTEEMIAGYIRLRREIEAMNREHAERVAPLEAAKEKLSGLLLARLNDVGSDKLAIRGVGTVFKAREDRASLADSAAFKGWVIANQQWNMTEWRAAKVAIREYIEKGNAPPPGVNFSTRVVAQVRSAPKTEAPDFDS